MKTNNKRAKSFESSKFNLLLTLVLIVLSGLIFMQDKQGRFDNAKNTIHNVFVNPIKTSSKWPSKLITSIKEFSHEKSHLLNEVKRQKLEIARLKAHLTNVNVMAAENRRLKSLLESTSKLTRTVSISEVTDSLIDANRHQISLNKGKGKGVFVGQIVVDENGVIGQVTETLEDSSVVDLITDSRQRVPVFIARNRLRMMVVGTGILDELELKFVSKDADIRVGDVLVSSGLGNRFPRGYKVGVIKNIKHNPASLFPEVTAKPVAALGKVLEVLLVDKSIEQLEKIAEQAEDKMQDSLMKNTHEQKTQGLSAGIINRTVK